MPTIGSLIAPSTIWKLQGTASGASAIFEVKPDSLNSGTVVWSWPPYVTVNPDATGIRLRVPMDGPTTSGSAFPRQEFRELKPDGTAAAWDTTKAVKTLTGRTFIRHLPPIKPSVCIAQIHGKSDDLFELLTVRVGNVVKVAPRVDGKTIEAEAVPYVGGVIDWSLSTNKGALVVKYAGHTFRTQLKADKGSYFKAGAYAQTNSSIEPTGEYVELDLMDLTLTEGAAVPAPPNPFPNIKPAANIVIIRHAEKPPDSGAPFGVTLAGARDIHSLTSTGWARAGALANSFVPALRPDRIYASMGKTDSRRPVQTVTPLALKLGLTIQTKYDATQTAAIAAELDEKGGNSLVCWAHTELPQITKALGVTTPAWPDDRFDLYWLLERVSGGAWKFTQLDQKLLAGDK